MELTITKDVEELERLEGIIHKNLQSFYEVGRALMGIRNGELYKVKNGGKYETFEAYCKGVWDFTKSYANYLVAATVVIDNISEMTTNVVKPVTEAQARSLAKLGAAKQIEAWQKAVETAPEGKVTAAYVYKIVKEMTTISEVGATPQKEDETEGEDSEILYNLKVLWRRATKKDKRKFLDWAGKDN